VVFETHVNPCDRADFAKPIACNHLAAQRFLDRPRFGNTGWPCLCTMRFQCRFRRASLPFVVPMDIVFRPADQAHSFEMSKTGVSINYY
jgi:hypothetical protein